jgi:hypothetical protein
MASKLRIRLDSIEQAHRALEGLPQNEPTEVTKAQAVQKLLAPIRASQAKGYSLAAIGKVLSDSGIPIAAGALRVYLSGAGARTGEGKRRKPKGRARAATRAQSVATPSAQPSGPAPTTAPAPKQAPTSAAPNVDQGWDPTARSADAPRPQEPTNRASFKVRPDTRDI